MSDKKKSKIDILPPIAREAEMPLDQPLQGISLLNRAKYWRARKELDAYLSALKARNAAMEEIIRGEGLKDTYHTKTLTRVERLEDLRRIEELKIDDELCKWQDAAEVREIEKLDREVRKIRLKTELAHAKRDLESAETPPQKPESNLSRGEQVANEIKRINADFAQIRASLIEAAGGEEKLDEEGRNALEQVEIARRNAISDLLESLR